jgi:ABC-type cobalamin transport system permease subunit
MSDLSTTGNLVAGLLLLASLAVWFSIADRWRRGEAPVAWQPREPSPWHPIAIGLALPVSIVVRQIVLSSATSADPSRSSKSGLSRSGLKSSS